MGNEAEVSKYVAKGLASAGVCVVAGLCATHGGFISAFFIVLFGLGCIWQ